MLKRRLLNDKPLKLYTKRFYPAGTYTWIVPPGCTEVDVFLVGAGGGSGGYTTNWGPYGAGGGGYTKTYRGSGYVPPSSGTWIGTSTEGRDGDSINVTPGQSIEIIVGTGNSGSDGGYSQFMNSDYRAEGGKASTTYRTGGCGGSGGGSWFRSGTTHGTTASGGSDGGDSLSDYSPSKGQGHTTRDFGEPSGKINAGGGECCHPEPYSNHPGESDYTDGTGGYLYKRLYNSPDGLYWISGEGGGGYGGGAGSPMSNGTVYRVKGGDGTVLIRYYAY